MAKRKNQEVIKVRACPEDKPPREITIRGNRLCQCVRALVKAGKRGISPLDHWAAGTRLSAYVHQLKRDYSLAIDTEHEEHSGGFHGRYRLRYPVEILPQELTEAAA